MKCLMCNSAWATKKFKEVYMCDECFNIIGHRNAIATGRYSIGDQFIIPHTTVIKSTDEYSRKETRYHNAKATIIGMYEDDYTLELDGNLICCNIERLHSLVMV